MKLMIIDYLLEHPDATTFPIPQYDKEDKTTNTKVKSQEEIIFPPISFKRAKK